MKPENKSLEKTTNNLRVENFVLNGEERLSYKILNGAMIIEVDDYQIYRGNVTRNIYVTILISYLSVIIWIEVRENNGMEFEPGTEG